MTDRLNKRVCATRGWIKSDPKERLEAQSIVSPILTCVFSNAQIEVEIRTLTDRRGLEYRVWSASTSLTLAYHTRYSNPRCDWHKPHIANSREIIVMSMGFNYMNILSSTRILIVIFFRLIIYPINSLQDWTRSRESQTQRSTNEQQLPDISLTPYDNN